ncbi:MAG: hypothetical protein LAP87_21250 [Acidobacteriia bacterium]|nr:hypothetical protein [Terriglobia bacterium]
MTRRLRFLSAALLTASLAPIFIYAHAGGPVVGKAGVPGELVCTICHSGSADSGPGSVRVTFTKGLVYRPGVKQRLVVTVADPEQKRWGFELTARQAANPKLQAGVFQSLDGNTQVLCADERLMDRGEGPCPGTMPLQYAGHTGAGSRLGRTGSTTFQLEWIPPVSDIGPVTIYVAGNAADGDNTPANDHIYTAQYTLVPAGRNPRR